MSARRRAQFAIAFTLAVVLSGWQRSAQAKSTFVVNNLDLPGMGFNDMRAAAPVGGNPGTTVGAQRLAAFKEAANIWAKALDSKVPVVIDAQFGPLACDAGRITLGQARATGLEANRPGLPPNMLFPEPLADRIAEVDLNPGEADIEATFNGDLLACSGGQQDWYYGFDAKPKDADIDLISVVLHELGHGLGFSSAVDDVTGSRAGEMMDAFSAHVFDNGVARAWPDMTNAQRAASARNFRHLVWNGQNVTKMAPVVLAKGAPSWKVTPSPGGLVGALAEANFGPLLAAGPTTGVLKIGTPIDGCAVPPNYTDLIVLFSGGGCPSVQKVSLAEAGGAAGVLIADPDGIAPPSSVDVPPDQEALFPVHIPVLGITIDDANLLIAAGGGSLSLVLDADANRALGVDGEGRMYLYASDPILPGSTVSHWDPLARPDLTQEPNSSYDVSHDIRLEVALMRDIGWVPFCGNGRLDPDEQCDSGASNSDTAPGACRTTCTNASCGDGVTDPGEQCDNAAANSDTAAGACRATCVSAACGDRVTDPGEACDDGPSNSDTMSGACRTACMSASCGDGVTDPGEQCDNGASNGADAACLPNCKLAAPPGKGCGCALDDGMPAWGSAATLLAALLLARARRRHRRAA